ncbi:hypothetical protein SK128_002852 [Halocaridina rubra]|uniref:Uncharacterized protein n=1 Tax=Halocaridina rubra TaxID=373956 RepID=A0AAN8WSG9_HALRR
MFWQRYALQTFISMGLLDLLVVSETYPMSYGDGMHFKSHLLYQRHRPAVSARKINESNEFHGRHHLRSEQRAALVAVGTYEKSQHSAGYTAESYLEWYLKTLDKTTDVKRKTT